MCPFFWCPNPSTQYHIQAGPNTITSLWHQFKMIKITSYLSTQICDTMVTSLFKNSWIMPLPCIVNYPRACATIKALSQCHWWTRTGDILAVPLNSSAVPFPSLELAETISPCLAKVQGHFCPIAIEVLPQYPALPRAMS